MAKYRKTALVEAMQIPADNKGIENTGAWVALADFLGVGRYKLTDKGLDIKTKEGTMHGNNRDYVCKGIKGEIWPVDREIFEATYELVPDA